MSDVLPDIPRAEWSQVLEGLTDQYEGAEVTIELLDQEFGDESEVQRLPLAYLEYDHQDDVVIVAVGGRDGRYPAVLRHIVEHPERILRDTLGPGGLVALDVVGRDESHTIVTLHEPRL
jgi:hypothetical protein